MQRRMCGHSCNLLQLQRLFATSSDDLKGSAKINTIVQSRILCLMGVVDATVSIQTTSVEEEVVTTEEPCAHPSRVSVSVVLSCVHLSSYHLRTVDNLRCRCMVALRP